MTWMIWVLSWLRKPPLMFCGSMILSHAHHDHHDAWYWGLHLPPQKRAPAHLWEVDWQARLAAVRPGFGAAKQHTPEVSINGVTQNGWFTVCNGKIYMVVCQNLVPRVNIKIAGKWMFIPLKMVLIGIDPYPYVYESGWFRGTPILGNFHTNVQYLNIWGYAWICHISLGLSMA